MQSTGQENTLVLQKSFLDFSHLDIDEFLAIKLAVQSSDCGNYEAARVQTIILPLLPFATISPSDRLMLERAERTHKLETIRTETLQVPQANPDNIFDRVKAAISQTCYFTAARALQFVQYIDKGSSELVDKLALERFAALDLPRQERYVYDFFVRVPTGEFVAEGYLFITNHFIIFDGRNRCSPKGISKKVRFSIPLWEVKSFHRAITKPTTLGQPMFSCVGFDSHADAVFVYTSDCKVHVFYGFCNLWRDNFNEFLCVLDYTWRNLAKPQHVGMGSSSPKLTNTEDTPMDELK